MSAESFLLYVYVFKLFSISVITCSSANSIADLLKPMKNLQIAIRLPETKCPGCREWQTTVERSLDYLTAMSTPVQIFPRFVQPPPPPRHSISFPNTRYVANRFACVVYTSKGSDSAPDDLQRFVIGCNSKVPKHLIYRNSRFEDLIYLIVLHKSLPTWTNQEKFRLVRCGTPFYFLVFHMLP